MLSALQAIVYLGSRNTGGLECSARVVSPESLKAKCVPQLTTAIGVRCQSQSQGGAGQQHKPDLDKCIFVVCPKKNRNFELDLLPSRKTRGQTSFKLFLDARRRMLAQSFQTPLIMITTTPNRHMEVSISQVKVACHNAEVKLKPFHLDSLFNSPASLPEKRLLHHRQ